MLEDSVVGEPFETGLVLPPETQRLMKELKSAYEMEKLSTDPTMMGALYWYLYDSAVQSIPGTWRKLRAQNAAPHGVQVSGPLDYIKGLTNLYAELKVTTRLEDVGYSLNRLRFPDGSCLTDQEEGIRRYTTEMVENALQDSQQGLVSKIREDYGWLQEFPNEWKLKFINMDFVNPLCNVQKAATDQTAIEKLVALSVVGGVLSKYLEPYANQYLQYFGRTMGELPRSKRGL